MLSELKDPEPVKSIMVSLLFALCCLILFGALSVHLDPILSAWHDAYFGRE